MRRNKTAFLWICLAIVLVTNSGGGVLSLPGLILTDKEHIVRAEGFAISELDQELHKLTNAKEKQP